MYKYLCNSLALSSLLDDDWPIYDVIRNRLRVHHMFLCDNIFVSELFLSHLYQADCINEMHKSEIQRCLGQNEMSSKLMFIMHRRSLAQYKDFLKSLREADCEFVADALESNGGRYVLYMYNY